MMVHDISIVAVAALCTFFIRAIPFLFFGRKKELPPTVNYLGKYLPSAVMVILIIYCMRFIDLLIPSTFLPQFIAAAIVVLIHLWKRNTLLSILCGTICYMILIQCVFI